jgi:hypothetical protein
MSPGNNDLFAQDATSGKGPVYGWAPGVVPGGPPKAAIP